MGDQDTVRSSRMVGYVDGVQDGDIIGWAVDNDCPDRPLRLRVCVGGEPVMTIVPVRHRADVAAAFGSAGMHGFSIKLPPGLCSDGRLEISVLSEDGGQLANSPLTVSASSLEPPHELVRSDTEPCLLFMHIQKTAGTALRHAIMQNYRGSELLLLYPTPPGIAFEHFSCVPSAQLRGLKCVLGHFMFGLHEGMERPTVYATLVRNPADRVVSQYHHLIRTQSPLIRSAGGALIELEDLLEMQTSPELDNLIVRFFAGQDERYPAGSVNLDSYRLAIDNLKYFRYIGHQEDSQNAWARLQSLFNWRRGALEMANVGDYPRRPLTLRLCRAIEHSSRYDLMFYEHLLREYPPNG